MGGPVSANTAYVVGEKGPELFVPGKSGSIVPNGGRGGNTINLTVNGAIDAEGTARTIIDVLNRSSARGTLGSAAFS
jgi:phage-related minor tail protein